jgi:hypothetical protein
MIDVEIIASRSNLWIYKVMDMEDDSLLGYGAVLFCISRLMLQRCKLPPSPGQSEYTTPYPKRLSSSYSPL